VSSLDIVLVIVPQRFAHASGIDVIGNDVGVISKLLFTDSALAVLCHDLSNEQLSHLSIRAKFAILSRKKLIFDSTHAKLSSRPCLLYCFPPATGNGTMYWADLVATESHDFSFTMGMNLE
jgi:hypothetical protein